MEARAADPTAPKWFNPILLALFAAIAVVLAAAGLYGIQSYPVSQRTAEIGIRMAVGAERQDVLRLVIAGGLMLAFAGIAMGAAA